MVIPVYNSELYIDECLQSILKQTIVENIELICVNDGSNDSSLDILNMYKTKFPNMIIIDQKNAGSAIARNNDAEALLRLFYNAKKVSFIDKFVYVYRIRANSITNSEKTEKGIISTKKY